MRTIIAYTTSLVITLASFGCAAEGAGSPTIAIDTYSLESESGDEQLGFEVDYVALEGASEMSASDHVRGAEPSVEWVSGDELLESAALGSLDESATDPGPMVASTEGECIYGDEPACVGGSSSALFCGGACVAGAVVAVGRFGYFVWRVYRTSRVIHASATITTRAGVSRTVTLHVSGRAAEALQTQVPAIVGGAVGTSAVMASLSDRHRVEEPVREEESRPEEEEASEEERCPNDRLFIPERTDEILLCTPASGAGILCTTRRHWPCAGTHTVGEWMFQYWDGSSCRTETRSPAYRCDGPSPDPFTALPCSYYTGSTSCGEGGPEVEGIWCGGARCPYSPGYAGL